MFGGNGNLEPVQVGTAQGSYKYGECENLVNSNSMFLTFPTIIALIALAFPVTAVPTTGPNLGSRNLLSPHLIDNLSSHLTQICGTQICGTQSKWRLQRKASEIANVT